MISQEPEPLRNLDESSRFEEFPEEEFHHLGTHPKLSSFAKDLISFSTPTLEPTKRQLIPDSAASYSQFKTDGSLPLAAQAYERFITADHTKLSDNQVRTAGTTPDLTVKPIMSQESKSESTKAESQIIKRFESLIPSLSESYFDGYYTKPAKYKPQFTRSVPSFPFDNIIVQIEPTSFSFPGSPVSLEPFFFTLGLFDTGLKCKITEDFYFDLNKGELFEMVRPFTTFPLAQKTCSERCIFSFDPSRVKHVYLVLKVFSTLTPANDRAYDDYRYSVAEINELRSTLTAPNSNSNDGLNGMILKHKHRIQHFGSLHQPFGWNYYSLFRGNQFTILDDQINPHGLQIDEDYSIQLQTLLKSYSDTLTESDVIGSIGAPSLSLAVRIPFTMKMKITVLSHSNVPPHTLPNNSTQTTNPTKISQTPNLEGQNEKPYSFSASAKTTLKAKSARKQIGQSPQPSSLVTASVSSKIMTQNGPAPTAPSYRRMIPGGASAATKRQSHPPSGNPLAPPPAVDSLPPNEPSPTQSLPAPPQPQLNLPPPKPSSLALPKPKSVVLAMPKGGMLGQPKNLALPAGMLKGPLFGDGGRVLKPSELRAMQQHKLEQSPPPAPPLPTETESPPNSVASEDQTANQNNTQITEEPHQIHNTNLPEPPKNPLKKPLDVSLSLEDPKKTNDDSLNVPEPLPPKFRTYSQISRPNSEGLAPPLPPPVIHSHPSTTRVMLTFPIARSTTAPVLTPMNILYLYPERIFFSNMLRGQSFRNILVEVRVKETDQSGNENGLPIIFNPSKGSEFVDMVCLNMMYHSHPASFGDEIKIALPYTLNPKLHVLFTFYHITCKLVRKHQNVVKKFLCYSVLSLNSNSDFFKYDTIALPITRELPPNYINSIFNIPLKQIVFSNSSSLSSTGRSDVAFIPAGFSQPVKFLGQKALAFSLRRRLFSTVFPQLRPVHTFITTSSTTRNIPRIRISLSQIKSTIDQPSMRTVFPFVISRILTELSSTSDKSFALLLFSTMLTILGVTTGPFAPFWLLDDTKKSNTSTLLVRIPRHEEQEPQPLVDSSALNRRSLKFNSLAETQKLIEQEKARSEKSKNPKDDDNSDSDSDSDDDSSSSGTRTPEPTPPQKSSVSTFAFRGQALGVTMSEQDMVAERLTALQIDPSSAANLAPVPSAGMVGSSMQGGRIVSVRRPLATAQVSVEVPSQAPRPKTVITTNEEKDNLKATKRSKPITSEQITLEYIYLEKPSSIFILRLFLDNWDACQPSVLGIPTGVHEPLIEAFTIRLAKCVPSKETPLEMFRFSWFVLQLVTKSIVLETERKKRVYKLKQSISPTHQSHPQSFFSDSFIELMESFVLQSTQLIVEYIDSANGQLDSSIFSFVGAFGMLLSQLWVILESTDDRIQVTHLLHLFIVELDSPNPDCLFSLWKLKLSLLKVITLSPGWVIASLVSESADVTDESFISPSKEHFLPHLLSLLIWEAYSGVLGFVRRRIVPDNESSMAFSEDESIDFDHNSLLSNIRLRTSSRLSLRTTPQNLTQSVKFEQTLRGRDEQGSNDYAPQVGSDNQLLSVGARRTINLQHKHLHNANPMVTSFGLQKAQKPTNVQSLPSTISNLGDTLPPPPDFPPPPFETDTPPPTPPPNPTQSEDVKNYIIVALPPHKSAEMEILNSFRLLSDYFVYLDTMVYPNNDLINTQDTLPSTADRNLTNTFPEDGRLFIANSFFVFFTITLDNLSMIAQKVQAHQTDMIDCFLCCIWILQNCSIQLFRKWVSDPSNSKKRIETVIQFLSLCVTIFDGRILRVRIQESYQSFLAEENTKMKFKTSGMSMTIKSSKTNVSLETATYRALSALEGTIIRITDEIVVVAFYPHIFDQAGKATLSLGKKTSVVESEENRKEDEGKREGRETKDKQTWDSAPSIKQLKFGKKTEQSASLVAGSRIMWICEGFLDRYSHPTFLKTHKTDELTRMLVETASIVMGEKNDEIKMEMKKKSGKTELDSQTRPNIASLYSPDFTKQQHVGTVPALIEILREGKHIHSESPASHNSFYFSVIPSPSPSAAVFFDSFWNHVLSLLHTLSFEENVPLLFSLIYFLAAHTSNHLFSLQNMHCSELCKELIQCCLLPSYLTRRRAAALILSLAILNQHEANNILRIRTQLTMAVSHLSNIRSAEEKRIMHSFNLLLLLATPVIFASNPSLNRLKRRALLRPKDTKVEFERKKTHVFRLFKQYLPEVMFMVKTETLVNNLIQILITVASENRLAKDNHSERIDLLFELSESYNKHPTQRLVWLDKIVEYQQKQGNLEEAAIAQTMRCLIICEIYVELVSRGEYVRPVLIDSLYPLHSSLGRAPVTQWEDDRGVGTDQKIPDLTVPNLKLMTQTFSRLLRGWHPHSMVNAADLMEGDPLSELKQSGMFTNDTLRRELQRCSELLAAAHLFEMQVEVIKLQLLLYQSIWDISSMRGVSTMLTHTLSEIESQVPETRLRHTFYRVGLFGVAFKELNGKEYVYAEKSVVPLGEMMDRLKAAYKPLVGGVEPKVIGAPRIEFESVTPNMTYSSMTSQLETLTHPTILLSNLDPILDSPDRMVGADGSLRYQLLSSFSFDQMYMRKDAVAGDVFSIHLLRSVIDLPFSFPFVAGRQEIDKGKVKLVHLNPSENAAQDLATRLNKIREAAMAKPFVLTKLQYLLSGALTPQINQGPMAIFRCFLVEHRADTNSEDANRIRQAFQNFFSTCRFCLEKHAEHCMAKDFHNALVEGFNVVHRWQ
ncbi:putative Dedicator of cytokinesis protein 8 [Blattamonas nauphoetae]|uniref:Dedicator of cytokinesis protein 8 n=1 Tax=Blattamonas nauphoetae TaxID=2049346 RepID=A0ABQ9X5T4_9EUKA|nr:putative Dedicator of cytokinesis protein 8 [Blattamonas nauphoetae]